MRTPLRHQARPRGFTLIELIAVIVIIGVLASVALPEVSNLAKEARITKVAQLKAALETAASDSSVICMTYPSCAYGGFGLAYLYVKSVGRHCKFINGFVDAGNDENGIVCEIHDFVRSDGFEVVFGNSTQHTDFRLKSAPNPSSCYARYTQVLHVATYGLRPTIVVETSGC